LLYTDEEAFNTDWDLINADNTVSALTNWYSKTISATQNNTDGYFNFNGILWETMQPVFGQDGDRKTVYLIFYHEDYIAGYYSTIITSDVTNSLPPVKIAEAKDHATISGTVVNTNTGEGINNVNIQIYVPISWTLDGSNNIDVTSLVFEDSPDYNTTTDANGDYSQEIAFNKKPSNTDDAEKVIVRIVFSRNSFRFDPAQNGADFFEADIDNDGQTETYYQTGEIIKDTVLTVKDINAKQTEFNESFSGRVFDSPSTDGVNGLQVKIWKNRAIDANPDFVTTTNSQSVTQDTIEKGHFQVNNITWTDETYTGNQSSIFLNIQILNQITGTVLTVTPSSVTIYSNATSYTEFEY
jgi:hypothetical protein